MSQQVGISPDGCVVDPAKEDWGDKDIGEVYHAAKAGIPQAQAELDRRERAAKRTFGR